MTQESDTDHRAQERENAEPEERIRPVPLAAAAITLAMVLFGVVYIFISDPFGNASLGDRRTVADLSGPVPAAAGAAVDGKAVFAAQSAGHIGRLSRCQRHAAVSWHTAASVTGSP